MAKKEHIIACAHCLINAKTHTITDQEILTNGFKTSNIDTNTLSGTTINFQGNKLLVILILKDIPFMTQDTLSSMKVEDLKNFCRKYNIRIGKKIQLFVIIM